MLRTSYLTCADGIKGLWKIFHRSEYSHALLVTFLFFSSQLGAEEQVVLATKRIEIEGCPGAFNPSLIAYKEGYLLTFRYIPSKKESWISYIGIILLDKNFEKTSTPQLLNTRNSLSKTPSQSEDARVLYINKTLYLVFNDNTEEINPTNEQNRDIFVTTLKEIDGKFRVGLPVKLVFGGSKQTWEKNWVPFEWKGELLLAYTISPHEILRPHFATSSGLPFHRTLFKNPWKWGTIRGGTPALLEGEEYLSFFHSSTTGKLQDKPLQYFLGAYTFSSKPPFGITKISPQPIMAKEFYEPCDYHKKVIFPGGFVVVDNQIYLAYGKDDSQIWIATLDKTNLKKSLAPINSYK